MLIHRPDPATQALEIDFQGNLLSSNVDDLRKGLGATLAELAPDLPPGAVWRLDLRLANFIDSSGLNLLVELCRQAAARQCRLEALIAHMKIKRLLSAVRLDRKITVIDSEPAGS